MQAILRALTAVLLVTVSCGGNDTDRCAIEASVDALFFCATEATTGGTDRVDVRGEMPGTLAASREVLRFSFPAPPEGTTELGWEDQGVVGGFDIVAPASSFGIVSPVGGEDPIVVDRHEARVEHRVSDGALVLHRQADGTLVGTFDFTAFGVTALGEEIPVRRGRFRTRLPVPSP